MTARTDLGDFLRTGFPDHNVYDSPPGNIELPAAVIAPDAPYCRQVTFCLFEWAFQVGFVTGRTASNQDLDTLDAVIAEAFPLLQELPNGTVEAVRSIDAMEIGGTPYVAAVFTVKVKGKL